MVDSYFNIAPYLTAITQGRLIITANSRLRNHMLRAYSQWQITQGASVSISPRIYSLSQYQEQLWQQLQRRAYAPTARRLINNAQRQTLWEQIIARSSLAAELLQPEPLAQAADAALRNLELWCLSEEQVRAAEPQINAQSNSACWLIWLGEFRVKLSQLGLITQEQALEILLGAFRDGELKPEEALILTGFGEIAPLHQALLDALSAEQITITQAVAQTELVRTEAHTTEEEIRLAARWSKTQLEQNPVAMIAIIVPNLGQCRDLVERQFVQVFEPLAALPEQPRYTLPFNFSAGTPLAGTPIIAATLDLLGLHQSNWGLEDICQLLLSPFFSAADTELVLRSHLIHALRQLGRFNISASDLRYHCQKLSAKLAIPEDEQHLTQRFLQLETHRRETYGDYSADYWRTFFDAHLQRLGWPGRRRLDSQEHQQLKLWQQLLDEFLQLDALGIKLSYSQALQQLRKLASKMPFQAQTPQAPIQILGALEGAGLQFSHCWVLGLHHRQWPPAPAPNPLLPTVLQRQHKMPHASAERELVFAQALTQHYMHCAPLVIFSSAHSDEGSELAPSALIRALALTPADELHGEKQDANSRNFQAIAASKTLELIDCAQAPAVEREREIVRGGASLFKEQGACPFNAFARLRLGAKSCDEPVPGLSAIERGNLLHEALALIWRQLGTQAQLLTLNYTELCALIASACSEVIETIKRRRGTSLGAYYAQLEQERLERLLHAWLEQEKMRPAFKVIAIEEEVTLEFSGLPLRLRIDRIDELATGEQLLIDYKTGSPSAKSWQGERMDEPQLPLYAVTATTVEGENPIGAIAFAQINAKASQWIGTGELRIQHPGIVPCTQEWPLQLQEWQLNLSRLAQDFLQGDARVDLKNPNAAQYAEDLLPLNRLLDAEAIADFIATHAHALESHNE